MIPPLPLMLIVLGGVGLGGRLALILARYAGHFAPANAAGIVSRITLSGYPSPQDVLYFYGGILGLSAFVVAYVSLWFGLRRAEALISGIDSERLLQSLAISQTAFILLLTPLPALLPFGLSVLLFPLAWHFSRHALPQMKLSLTGSPGYTAPSRVSSVLIPVLLYLLFLELKVNGFIDFFHEGERLVPLQVYLTGGLPFRDVYLQHGLGSNFLLPVVAAKLFEPTLEGVRLLARLLDPLAYVALYFFGLVLYRSRAPLALLLVAIVSGSNFWLGFRQGIALAAITVLLVAFRRLDRDSSSLSRRLFVFAGFLMGAAFWYSLEIGLYVLIAAVGWLVLLLSGIRERKQLLAASGYLLLGWLLPGVPIVLALLRFGILDDAIRNIVEQVSYQSLVWGLPFPSFTEAPAWYLPVFTYLVTALFLCFRFLAGARDRFTQELLLIELCALMFFRTALGRSDYGHWIDGSVFFWILLLIPVDFFLCSARRALTNPTGWFVRHLPLGVLSAAILAYAVDAHEPLGEAGKRFGRFSLKLSGQSAEDMLPRAGKAMIPKDQAKIAEKVIEHIRSRTVSDTGFFDFTNQAAYYFFADRKPPSRYYHAVYAATAAQQQALIEDLEQNGVNLVLFKTGSAFDAIDGVPQEQRQPYLQQYLQDNFCFDASLGTVQFLKRCDTK